MAKKSKPARMFDLRTGRKLTKTQVIQRLSKKKVPKIRLFKAGGIKVVNKAQLLRLLESPGAEPPVGTLNAPFKLAARG